MMEVGWRLKAAPEQALKRSFNRSARAAGAGCGQHRWQHPAFITGRQGRFAGDPLCGLGRARCASGV